jgi:beta-glucanase (GH16 family)
MTTYTFEDNFTGKAGSAPDPSKWDYDLGRWTDNNELETYTDSRTNSYLDGQGHLVIKARRASVPSYSKGNLATRDLVPGFTSARLTSKFSQAYGCFEARIKISPQAGLWPAWWMIGENYTTVGWPACGEIDMLEQYGGLTPVYAESTVHVPDGHGGIVDPIKGVTYQDVPLKTGWHTYRVWWTDKVVQFHMDGTQYLETPPQPGWTYSSGVPMFMILNLAVGGTGGGTVPAQFGSAEMLVDYVRAWE